MTTLADNELFDPTPYQIPFPKIDGHEVNELALRLAGNLALNRNDPEHVALIESLTLGRHVRFIVTATVVSKGQTFKDDEQVTHTVGLKLHMIEQDA